MSRFRSTTLVSAGLVILTLLTYGRLGANDFINLDDEVYVTKNDHVKMGLQPRSVAWAWKTFHAGYYQPLTWMSLQLDATLSGRRLNATVFHLHNLLWHAVTTVLLFRVLHRLTGALGHSALVAALFAVHPLHVESVAWATERKDVLSTFFFVLTLAAYARYVRVPSLRSYLAVAAAFVCGLLAKPMLVTLPCVLLLLDYWPLGRIAWRAGSVSPLLLPTGSFPPPLARQRPLWLLVEKLPLFVLAAAASVVTVFAQRFANAIQPTDALPVSERLANILASYGWYLAKTFWPSDLGVHYLHPGPHWQWPPVLAGGAVLLPRDARCPGSRPTSPLVAGRLVLVRRHARPGHWRGASG